MTIRRGLWTVLSTCLATNLWAQSLSVSHRDGLVTIQCDNSPLSSVFEQLERQAGIELILEDAVKSKRLTASLVDVPVSMAVSRLLEGIGVNYAVMMSPRDWGRVDKVFVGAGGDGPARSSAPARALPEPPEDDYDDFKDPKAMIVPGFYVPEDKLQEEPQQDFVEFPNPPGSSPGPSFLPPTPSYPRSNFTPGLPNNRPPPRQGGTGSPGATSPANPPPSTFPFMDPFGWPSPVPPDMNQQQDQDQDQPSPQP
jgi:hypothetical protein